MVVARISRAERKAQTRRALLDAGRELFVREGFHAATLDRVAAEAGFTKGAVYASFPTKADLFLAIFEERVEARVARFEEAARRAKGYTALRRALQRDWQEIVRGEQGWTLLLLEFWVHAARDPELAARLLELRRRVRDTLVDLARAAGAEEVLEMDVEELVAAQLALGNGYNLEACLDPRAASGARLRRAGEALFAGASR
jgi:AcrR family transcriptional regulator